MRRVATGLAVAAAALVLVIATAAAGVVSAIYGGGYDGHGLPPPGVAVSLPPGFHPPGGHPAAGRDRHWVGPGAARHPYTFGGDCTAAHSGVPARQCDCSSLMQQAYRAAGVTIGRTTRDQVHDGTPIPSARYLRPGDLILIPGSGGTHADPRHVGMFIGSGLIVQAPKTGDVVRVSKLSGWADQIAAIRRVIPS